MDHMQSDNPHHETGVKMYNFITLEDIYLVSGKVGNVLIGLGLVFVRILELPSKTAT